MCVIFNTLLALALTFSKKFMAHILNLLFLYIYMNCEVSLYYGTPHEDDHV